MSSLFCLLFGLLSCLAIVWACSFHDLSMVLVCVSLFCLVWLVSLVCPLFRLVCLWFCLLVRLVCLIGLAMVLLGPFMGLSTTWALFSCVFYGVGLFFLSMTSALFYHCCLCFWHIFHGLVYAFCLA